MAAHLVTSFFIMPIDESLTLFNIFQRVLHPALFEAMKRIGVRKDSDETSEEEYDEESETNGKEN